MRMILRKFLFGSLVLSASCSYHPYNPENETAYLYYWCNPNNRDSSIWSVFDQGGPLGTDNNPLEADSKEECLIRNGQIEK